jgi:NADH:ubiquinone oxidoreductase subunit H
MRVGWKVLLPVSLGVVILVALVGLFTHTDAVMGVLR